MKYKKIFIVASLLYAFNLSAQDATIMSRDFWSANPDLAAVKKTIEKEKFSFKDVTAGEDPLNLAINNDASAEVINYLIDQPGVDLQRGIHEGRTYLHSAASKGNTVAIECLLKKGADMYYTDAHDQTALTYSAYVGKITLPVIEAFVKNGLDVNKKYTNKGGANLLLLAVPADKDLSMTNYLVSRGVSLQSTDDNGNTIFDYAARFGNINILKALLQKGVKPSANALFMAAQGPFRSANKIDIFQYLVDELKIDPKTTNDNGQNVLHPIAAKQNQDDIIIYFVNKGVDINQADKNGVTPFMGAASSKNIEIVTQLLSKMKNVNAVNAKGESALTNAVKSSSAEVVALLLKNGADAKIVDKEGNNLAFHLIDSYRGAGGFGGRGGGFAGRSGGQQNAGGNGARPAQASPSKEFGDKLNALQAAGLNVTVPLKEENTLYHLAIAKNDVELLKSLAPLNLNINAKNKEGLTALHKAAMLARNDNVLKYLVSVGAKKDVTTSFGETAFDLAHENEFLKKDNVSVDFLK